MKEYSSDQIRNVAVVSHDGAGKTALVESLLLTSVLLILLAVVKITNILWTLSQKRLNGM